MKSAKWDEYIRMLIESLGAPEDETETWLALVAGQQAIESISVDRIAASGIDKNADGVLDAFLISVPASRDMVKDALIRIDMDFEDPF